MTDNTDTDRGILSGSALSQLDRAYSLGKFEVARYLPDGLMNQNWQVECPAGVFALKRVTDAPLTRLSRNLGVLRALATDGVPVSAAVATASGSLVAEVAGSAWCLFPWVNGTHVRGTLLSVPQTADLGAQLACLHRSLSRAQRRGLLAEVPPSMTADVTSPGHAMEKADKLTAAAASRGAATAFDVAAAAALEERRALIEKHADRRPEQGKVEGKHGWTHGDVQYRNLLWEGGELVAILDWDRVGVRPYAEEVARTAQVQFGVDGVFDLARVSAFVRGYRSVVPLAASALADGARRLWWKRMTDFWQLEFHYDRGDFSFDELFTADEALLHWWTDQLDQVEGAFTAG